MGKYDQNENFILKRGLLNTDFGVVNGRQFETRALQGDELVLQLCSLNIFNHRAKKIN